MFSTEKRDFNDFLMFSIEKCEFNDFRNFLLKKGDFNYSVIFVFILYNLFEKNLFEIFYIFTIMVVFH